MYSPASLGYAHGPASYGMPSLGYGAHHQPLYGRPSLYSPAADHASRPYERQHYSPFGLEARMHALATQSHGGFRPDDFLAPDRDELPLERDDSRLLAIAREAFRATTGFELDTLDLRIQFCTPSELRKRHLAASGTWDNGILGFSLNRAGTGASEIFVKDDSLDRLLLTLGHEIGHVLSPSLPDARDEEAKAFAFSIAWMKAIKREDIAGLGTAIVAEHPAENGVHDIGLAFVEEHINRGEDPINIFRMLARQELSTIHRPELIIMEG